MIFFPMFSITLTKINKIQVLLLKYELSLKLTFLNERYFFFSCALFFRKSAKFATNCRNMNFLDADIFKSTIFFSLHKPDISLRIDKFVIYMSNCWNKNFPCSSIFFKYAFFFFPHTLVFCRKLAKLSKHKFFSRMIFFESMVLLHKYDLFSWLIFLKIHNFFSFHKIDIQTENPLICN